MMHDFSLATTTVCESLPTDLSPHSSERILYVSPAESISTEMRVGDVLLPNTFVTLHQNGAQFIESYNAHEDIDFDTFGLRIGGIHLSGMPLDRERSDDNDIHAKYAEDSMTGENLTEAVRVLNATGLPFAVVLLVTHMGEEALNIDTESEGAKRLSAMVRYLIDSQDAPVSDEEKFGADEEGEEHDSEEGM